MNAFCTRTYQKKNEALSNEIQNNPDNTPKEKNTESLQNIVIRYNYSEDQENFQNLNIIKKKSSESSKNCNSAFEILKNEGFSFLDENEENLINIIGEGLKFIEDGKISDIDEKSTNSITDADQKSFDLFTNILFFSDDENEEKKIIDFSDDEDGNNIMKDLKLINENSNVLKTNKENENIKSEIIDMEVVSEHEQNINNNNEDINKSYLEKGWEDFSFLEQTYSIDEKQMQKQILNNSNNKKIQNVLNENQLETNLNFPINFNIMNQITLGNNNNYNCFTNNMLQNNSIKEKEISKNKNNNKFNNPKNSYFQNLNIKDNTFQNSYNKTTKFTNYNFLQHKKLERKNINNFPQKKHDKKDINKNNLIDINNIKSGLEKRTTVRMMNIPSNYMASDLSMDIDQLFNIDTKKENRTYNYVYVPGSMRNSSKNVGFAFINFMHPKHIIKFYEYYQNKKLRTGKGNKICSITFADRQKTEKDFGKDINPNGNYIIFNDTKNHYLLFDN